MTTKHILTRKICRSCSGSITGYELTDRGSLPANVKNFLTWSSYKCTALFLYVILFASWHVVGKSLNYTFHHLTVNEGLSRNVVNAVYRDSRGFVWIGTRLGLDRFDGVSVESFDSGVAGKGLSVNSVRGICEDFQHNLYVASSNGLFIIDHLTNEIEQIDYSRDILSGCTGFRFINCIFADSKGFIWFGTNNGFFFYDPKLKHFEHVLVNQTDCYHASNSILSMVEDQQGKIWFTASDNQIRNFDRISKSFTICHNPFALHSESNLLNYLFVDSKNNLWVGNINGLTMYQISSQKWLMLPKNASDPQINNVASFTQDKNGNVWVATDGKGAFVFDSNLNLIENLTHEDFNSRSISSNGLSYILCDSKGTVWIGTTKCGLNYCHPLENDLGLIRMRANTSNTLSSNDVNAFAEDDKSNLWIGTDGGGVDYLDRKSGTVSPVQFPSAGNVPKPKYIVSLLQGSNHRLWIGSYLQGLYQYDTATGILKNYRTIPNDSTSISDNRIYALLELDPDHLLIGTLGGGVCRLTVSTGKFQRFTTKNSGLCFDFITSFYKDRNSMIWIGTTFGLSCFDPARSIFVKRYQNPAPDGKLFFSDNNIVCTYEDSRGFFWVATLNGLNVFDLRKERSLILTSENGLPSNCVHSILEDDQKNLWISTNRGLSKLVVEQSLEKDSFKLSTTNFSNSDGIQGKEFNINSAIKTRDGQLFFGGPDGINGFYPSSLKSTDRHDQLIIRDFRIFNKSIAVNTKYNGRIILQNPIFNTESLELKYSENSFTIEFLALNYYYPERNQYEYRLDDFDPQWILCDGRKNSATYTNLNNGTYNFRVRQVYNDGQRGQEKTLKIIVLPPFWKSWMALVLYVGLISILLLILRRLILLRERYAVGLQQERLEAQRQHELDSLKIRFFTNLSHEFRTPLSLILAPLEKLMSKGKEHPEFKTLEIIEQNAKRMLRMVNQLLDFRKLEVQGFSLNPSYGDLVSSISEMVTSFVHLSEQKHIHLSFTSEIKSLHANFDWDKLEKIIFNLLSNAFKFTPSNGSVSVTLQFLPSGNQNDHDQVVIKVKDSGIGIAKDQQEKIFQRFFQVDNSGQVELGTGIGLSLVCEFVKLHQGEILVTSELGIGSCFTITLPVLRSETSQTPARDTQSQSDSLVLVCTDPQVTNGQKISSDRPCILIAEDHDDLRFYLKDNLSVRYGVLEAADGLSAWNALEENHVDLVISDIMMPGMDGIELCKKIKGDQNYCHIPVVLLTARSSDIQQLEGLESGAEDYITKPFNFQILEAKIANLIQSRRQSMIEFNSKLKIEPKDIAISSLDEQLMAKALDLVERNISNSDYSVEQMARELRMSRTQLYKKLMALTGKPPMEFIRVMRMKRAAQLLLKSQKTVAEVAFHVGYNDPKYFAHHFKTEFGVLPSKYNSIES